LSICFDTIYANVKFDTVFGAKNTPPMLVGGIVDLRRILCYTLVAVGLSAVEGGVPAWIFYLPYFSLSWQT